MAEIESQTWTEERKQDLLEFLGKDYSVFAKGKGRSLATPRQREDVITFIANTVGLPFSDALIHLIDLRGYTDVEVYKAAKVDRRVFSKLRSNSTYQPSRNTAIRLCLAMHLSALETMNLLERAGFCLSRSKKEDLVILYCLEHGIFDVDDVNQALLDLGLEGIY